VIPSLAVTEICHLLADPQRRGRVGLAAECPDLRAELSALVGYAGKSLAVPARAMVLVRAVMSEGVMMPPMREDRGRSGGGNRIDEGLLLLLRHQFFIVVVGSSLFSRHFLNNL
jgi:hypothetical protein